MYIAQATGCKSEIWKEVQVNIYCIAVMPEPGGPGGPLAPPIFGSSVDPILTRGGQIMPTNYYKLPKNCHLPASLNKCDG